MIRFKKVTKTYPRAHVHALRNVSFRISGKEFVYIIGHSGAGKSTLLSLILRRTLPTDGIVTILDHDTSKLRRRQLPYLRRNIGMIFQDHRLLANMSVLDNLTFVLRAVGGK